eukprot:1180370-Prorocentrum_minimum.AAC.3
MPGLSRLVMLLNVLGENVSNINERAHHELLNHVSIEIFQVSTRRESTVMAYELGALSEFGCVKLIPLGPKRDLF